MKLKTIKTAGEIALDGIRTELEIIDNGVRAIRLQDSRGNFLRVECGPSYTETIKVQVIEPPKMYDKWELRGTVCGLQVKQTFDTQAEAGEAARGYERDSTRVALEVVPVQVPADTTDMTCSGPVVADSDIPF